MLSREQIMKHKMQQRMAMARSFVASDVSNLEKGKKVPVGTVSNGMKKHGEGDWRKVTEGGKKETGSKSTVSTGIKKWQDAGVGDSARVKSANKMGTIIKTYGRKFQVKFVDGSDKTFDASDLEIRD